MQENITVIEKSKKVRTMWPALFATLGMLLGTQVSASVITFDSLIAGKSSFGFDADRDGASDVIFSTTDPSGFNTIGPGANQAFISEPGLEGTSLLGTDLRVDFLNGARNSLSYGFALNSSQENTAFGTTVDVFDRSGRKLGSSSSVGRFEDTGGGSQSSFPEGEAEVSFNGVAAYATFGFESEFGRFILDNFTGDFSRRRLSSGGLSRLQLQASVIESAANYIDTAEDVTDRRNEINEILRECTRNMGRRDDGSDCDYDALRRGEVEANVELAREANEAAFNSKDLVTRTSLLPGDSILEWLADLPFLIGESLGFFKVTGVLEGDEQDPEVDGASIDGEVGEFSINPDFVRYDVDAIVDFSSSTIFTELVGQKFLFDYSFDDSFETEIGIGLIQSVGTNIGGGDRVVFNFSQLSTNDRLPAGVQQVPSPGTLLLCVVGLLALFYDSLLRKSTGALC
ncbi:MAG: hypothetical protein AAF933_02040 [Pseudomonadota bacterium]